MPPITIIQRPPHKLFQNHLFLIVIATGIAGYAREARVPALRDPRRAAGRSPQGSQLSSRG